MTLEQQVHDIEVRLRNLERIFKMQYAPNQSEGATAPIFRNDVERSIKQSIVAHNDLSKYLISQNQINELILDKSIIVVKHTIMSLIATYLYLNPKSDIFLENLEHLAEQILKIRNR